MSFQDRIDAGIKLLDEKTPGWEKKIDFDTLRLNSFMNCVLGQVYGDYFQGVRTLFPGMDTSLFVGEADREAAKYGFYPDENTDWYEVNPTAMWVESINRKLSQVG